MINCLVKGKNILYYSVNITHCFASYTPRKVFVPKQELDKFYNTNKSFRLASARTIK